MALAPLSGVGAAQEAGNATAGNQSFVAVQGEECTPITPITGNESAQAFYDYRLPAEFADNPYINTTGSAFGSEGTLALQEPNTSVVFLYTDTNGTNDTADDERSLVFVHGAEADNNSTGGAATFDITGLPEDGDWTVRDDDYNGTSNEDIWNVSENGTVVDWVWGSAATDGGVHSDIDEDANVTIEPAFNEDAELYGEFTNETVDSWQVLSNNTTADNITRTELAQNETLRIAGGTCGDVGNVTNTDPADNETDAEDETDGGEGNETAGDAENETVAENETASVSFEDQESDGTTVTVENATLPEDGYLTIHNESLLDGDAVGSVVGVSEYQEAGEYENLTVELFDVPGTEFNQSELTENQTLVAMPHEETSDDETYDFVSTNGTDDVPFLADGEAVTDDANITVVDETDAAAENETDGGEGNETETSEDEETVPETASVSFEDQESDGTTVTVENVSLPESGYVAIHNESLLDGDAVGSVVGVSEYLEAGEYEDLTVELFDVPGTEFNQSELTENQTLIAMPHVENSGDTTYDFVSTNQFLDRPFIADGGPITDAGSVTVTDLTATADNETEENATEEEDTTTETPEEEDTATETPEEDTTTETPEEDTTTETPEDEETEDNATETPEEEDTATETPEEEDTATETPEEEDTATETPEEEDTTTETPEEEDTATETPEDE